MQSHRIGIVVLLCSPRVLCATALASAVTRPSKRTRRAAAATGATSDAAAGRAAAPLAARRCAPSAGAMTRVGGARQTPRRALPGSSYPVWRHRSDSEAAPPRRPAGGAHRRCLRGWLTATPRRVQPLPRSRMPSAAGHLLPLQGSEGVRGLGFWLGFPPASIMRAFHMQRDHFARTARLTSKPDPFEVRLPAFSDIHSQVACR